MPRIPPVPAGARRGVPIWQPLEPDPSRTAPTPSAKPIGPAGCRALRMAPGTSLARFTGTMQFRYKDLRGRAVELPDVASLLQAMESGAITPDCQLSVGSDGPWQRADSVAAYQEAVAALSRAPNLRRVAPPDDASEPKGAAESAPPIAAPWRARRALHIGLGVGAGTLLLVLGVLRLRVLDRNRASETARAVSAASGPSLASQHSLSVMTAEFGDSMALTIRRTQDWFDAQRIGVRLRGASLKNPASLRAIRVAAVRVSANADSLVAQGAVLAGLLKTQADSLEVADARYDGLLIRLEEALEMWGRDLDGYAELERGVAATVDSLAAFFLERQRSFALTEGRAVFLSRADATRFHDLSDQLRVLGVRRTTWADGVFSRRPSWMATVSDSGRPRFGGPILKGS